MATIIGQAGTYYALVRHNNSLWPLASTDQVDAIIIGQKPLYESVTMQSPYDGDSCRQFYVGCAGHGTGRPFPQSSYFKEGLTQQAKTFVTTGRLTADGQVRQSNLIIFLQPGQDPLSNGKAPVYWEGMEFDETSALIPTTWGLDHYGSGPYFKVAFSNSAPV